MMKYMPTVMVIWAFPLALLISAGYGLSIHKQNTLTNRSASMKTVLSDELEPTFK